MGGAYRRYPPLPLTPSLKGRGGLLAGRLALPRHRAWRCCRIERGDMAGADIGTFGDKAAVFGAAGPVW